MEQNKEQSFAEALRKKLEQHQHSSQGETHGQSINATGNIRQNATGINPRTIGDDATSQRRGISPNTFLALSRYAHLSSEDWKAIANRLSAERNQQANRSDMASRESGAISTERSNANTRNLAIQTIHSAQAKLDDKELSSFETILARNKQLQESSKKLQASQHLKAYQEVQNFLDDTSHTNTINKAKKEQHENTDNEANQEQAYTPNSIHNNTDNHADTQNANIHANNNTTINNDIFADTQSLNTRAFLDSLKQQKIAQQSQNSDILQTILEAKYNKQNVDCIESIQACIQAYKNDLRLQKYEQLSKSLSHAVNTYGVNPELYTTQNLSKLDIKELIQVHQDLKNKNAILMQTINEVSGEHREFTQGIQLEIQRAVEKNQEMKNQLDLYSKDFSLQELKDKKSQVELNNHNNNSIALESSKEKERDATNNKAISTNKQDTPKVRRQR